MLPELLAAIRKLRTALENPTSDPGAPELTLIPLSDDDADEIDQLFGRVLRDTPDSLPAGVELKLHSLLPIWGLRVYCKSVDIPNRIRRRHLNTVREIEEALLGLALAGPSRLQAAARNQGEGTGDAKGAKGQRRRGRTPHTVPRADQRVFDAWKTGQYDTYADCAVALKLKREEVKAALDRHRKRSAARDRKHPPAPE